jgi:excisionase family DNA binding protein
MAIDMMKDADRLTLSVDEAGKMLGLSRGLMYQAIRKGEIPSIRIGRRILIPRAALHRMLKDAVDHDVK